MKRASAATALAGATLLLLQPSAFAEYHALVPQFRRVGRRRCVQLRLRCVQRRLPCVQPRFEVFEVCNEWAFEVCNEVCNELHAFS